ncbi:class I SAM-dependent methyltransferase [Paraburkholderia sp. J12]|uniref:class I SAM-dependent methyltransferase n=1 Tax=Paraburkholderia sp. J12 TaxID=2805432 RepID=UPI002ABE16F9|nr:class I SAM-dependent methyltransferase [Paraburkholderia sp. J12]
MITKQDVVAAYQLLLRRAPESEEAIDHWLERCAYPDELVNGILGSKEFEVGLYNRSTPTSSIRPSDEEIVARFGVYPEPDLVHWLRNLPAIEGMVLPSSAYISAALAQFQARNDYRGNIAEIGVYHGKYLAGLATSIRPGEKVIAVDLFEDQDQNEDVGGYSEAGFEAPLRALTQDVFAEVMSTYAPHAELLTIKRSSLNVTADELMPDGQRVRFFSVDGGHTHDVFLNDLRLAETTLAPYGIVSIDDILNPDWPGIITAAVRYFDGTTKLRPVAFIENKLLCAYESHADIYRTALRNIAPRSLRRRDVEFSNYTADEYVDGFDLYAFLRSLPL